MDNFDPKRLMVMGAGGVGGYFGGRVSQKNGYELSLVARGEHLRQIQKHGLRVDSIDGNFVIKAAASDDPASLPKPDLILFTVKSYDTEGAIELIRPVVGADTQILPLQNGIENIPRLVDAFGDQRVIRGICRVGAKISEPGKVSHTSRGSIIVGEAGGQRSSRVETICNAFSGAGLDCRISDHIRREIWRKFSWNSIFNMLTAAENVTTDKLFDGEKPTKRVRRLAEEFLKIADAENAGLESRDLERTISKTRDLGAFITSTLYDRRRGKTLEYDAFTGALLRLAEKHSLELPEYEKLHDELKRINSEYA